MTLWQNIKKWLYNGCVYFTVISALLLLPRLLSGGTPASISVGAFLLLIPAGMLFSAGDFVRKSKKLPSWARYLLHYAITVLTIFLFILLPSGAIVTGSTKLILFVGISILYWVIFGLIMLVRSRIRKLMEED